MGEKPARGPGAHPQYSVRFTWRAIPSWIALPGVKQRAVQPERRPSGGTYPAGRTFLTDRRSNPANIRRESTAIPITGRWGLV